MSLNTGDAPFFVGIDGGRHEYQGGESSIIKESRFPKFSVTTDAEHGPEAGLKNICRSVELAGQ